jgi:elongation factor 1-gamma
MRSLDALNTFLASTTFLVGHSVTLADIVMTCNLYSGFRWILNKDFTSEFPHVERYFWTMVNHPNFKKIIGDVKQAEGVPAIRSYAPPAKTKEVKKEALKEAKRAPKKAKKEAQKEVKRKVAPKESKKDRKEAKKESPKKTPKPVVEAPDEETLKPKPKPVVVAPEEDTPKSKPENPLDLLPPSKMVLDDWKRLYSNTKSNFHEVAVKGIISVLYSSSISYVSDPCNLYLQCLFIVSELRPTYF